MSKTATLMFEDPVGDPVASPQNSNRSTPTFGRLPDRPSRTEASPRPVSRPLIFSRPNPSPLETTSDGEESLVESSSRAARDSLPRVRNAQPAADPAIDAALVAILDGQVAPGDTIAMSYRRKEHALGAVFATLGILAARAMHARLANLRTGDDLATRFARLTAERRGRLLDFLADARRRAALGGHP